jgi:Tfp pilus assembly protein PilF/regulator of protease activity HflC (stomatin/prohibitin superfamily)
MKRTAVLSALLAAVVVVALVLGIRRVPSDSRAVIETRGLARPAAPGLHWITPGLDRLAVYPARGDLVFPGAADTASGGYRIFSSEGAPIELLLSLQYELAPQGLTPFHQAARGRPREALSAILKPVVRDVLARHPATALRDPPAQDAIGRELTAALDPRFREIGITLGALRVERLGLSPGSESALATAHAASRKRRVLILGIDSADWTIVNRLRAAGRLPTFDRLVREGASGPLRSIEPLLSPLIWTTIATGVGPEVHGILDFLVRDPDSGRMVPATSRFRRTPAIWNISSGYGKKTGIVGWLATWPAEAIDGFVISDRFGFLAFAGQAGTTEASDLVHPPDLLEDRAALIVTSRSLGARQLGRYLDVPASEIEAHRRDGYEKGNLTNNFIHTLATAETWAGLGLDLWRSERPDIECVYFEFLDAVSHLFMSYAPPLRPGVDPADFRRYARAVDAAYERQDEILGTYLEAAGDSTVVLVLSDHGFRSGNTRLEGQADMEDAKAARWHLPDGVLLIHGPNVRSGVRLEGARVFDIAPTVLALLGCPATPDMSGRVLSEAFAPGTFTAADTIRTAHPRLTGFAPADRGAETASGEPAQRGTAGRNAASEHINLGIVHARNGRPLEAESEFKKALEADPHNLQAANNLASIYSQQERYPEALLLLRDLLTRNPDYAMGWSNLAVAQQRTGKMDEALESYDHALKLEPNDQRSLTNRGFLLLDMKQPERAEKDFRRALQISDRIAKARFGLGMSLAELNRRSEAVAELEKALAIDPGNAAARRALDELRQ